MNEIKFYKMYLAAKGLAMPVTVKCMDIMDTDIELKMLHDLNGKLLKGSSKEQQRYISNFDIVLPLLD